MIRTALITGGAGFIGSHLAEAALARGATVKAIDNLSTGTFDNLRHLADNERFQFARADIRDATVLDRLASESDVIFHLAAAVGVQLIIDRPVQTIETNIAGTEAVLKAVARYGCRVIVASTSEVYGKGTRVPFSEQDDLLLGPTKKCRWSYAASKIIDEFLALAYAAEFGTEAVIVRLFNTVGPRQTGRYGMVIPRLVRQAVRGEPLTVYGDGSQSRCFADVRDVVEALLDVAVHPASPGQVFNIGGQEEVTILQLAQRVKTLADSKSAVVLVPYEEAYAPGFEDIERRVPDISAIGRLLKWRPKRTLDEILRSVIELERNKLHVHQGQAGDELP